MLGFDRRVVETTDPKAKSQKPLVRRSNLGSESTERRWSIAGGGSVLRTAPALGMPKARAPHPTEASLSLG